MTEIVVVDIAVDAECDGVVAVHAVTVHKMVAVAIAGIADERNIAVAAVVVNVA